MSRASASIPEAPTRKEIGRLVGRRTQIIRERLGYINEHLNREQREFLILLPLLLHINHPSLPGYAGNDTPAGISGYEPDRYALLSARRFARSLKKQRRPQRVPPIQGLYLIGSSGTLGQDRQSDFDIWVCHDPQLGLEQRSALEQKTLALEAYGSDLGLQLHFFILHAEGFRQGQHNALSDESSGNTQHHLLLEEFYRTGLLLAGRPPLWWIVPPEQLPNYREYCDTLVRQRFIRENDWLDFGGLEAISPGEFFSAAHWQLFKGIQVPYKSLLKLLLFEAFASTFPQIRWLAEEAHARYHGSEDISAIDVDPYLLMMQRIEAYLKQQGQSQRLLLARRALYLKSGVRLSTGQESWKTPIFRQLCREWGWDKGELINLDRHKAWKLERVIEERNQLMGELSHSYRLLTTLAREHDALHHIDMRDLSLLGRKLFASLERRPGKIDLVNPGISEDLHQETVWLRRKPETGVWQCFLTAPEDHGEAVKSAISIVEILLWLSANQVIDASTRIDLSQSEMGMVDQEHLRILRALWQHFPHHPRKPAPLGEFAHNPHGCHALAVINAMRPPRHPGGLLLVSQRADPLSFGPHRENLITHIDYVYENSWGELHVAHHMGNDGLLDMLCRHLNLFIGGDHPGTLNCHCDTAGHGITIARRLRRLVDQILAHFLRHGNDSRYLLQIEETFYGIQRQRGQFRHYLIGEQSDMIDYLGEEDGCFHNTEIDAASLQGSPLPLAMRLNRPGRLQLAYCTDKQGIHSYLLDANGTLVEQWLPGASEAHFLNQQQRFFSTLQDWHQAVAATDKALMPEFLRLHQINGKWNVQQMKPPRENKQYGELILVTGPRGPWQDGFSLLAGEKEFNSVALGERIYQEAAAYLKSLRQGDQAYPYYLSGVLSNGYPMEPAFRLTDLIRFKVRIEQRLNTPTHPV